MVSVVLVAAGLKGLHLLRDVLAKVETVVVFVAGGDNQQAVAINLALPKDELEAVLRDPRIRRGMQAAEVAAAEAPTCGHCGKFT